MATVLQKFDSQFFGVVSTLLSVQIIFAFWPVAVKVAFADGISVLELSLFRDVFASAMLCCFMFMESSWVSRGVGRTGRETSQAEETLALSDTVKTLTNDVRKHFRLFLFLGVCSFVNSCGYVLALLYVTPFNSVLLHPCIPVFASALGVYEGVQQLTTTRIVGTAICIVGSLAVVLAQPSDSLQMSLENSSSMTLFAGNLLLVAQSLAMAALLVYQKFVPKKFSPLKTTAVYYSIGTVVSLPLSVTIVSYTGWVGLTSNICLVIAFGAIFVIGFNYAALTWVNKILSPAIPSASMMLQPPLAYFASHILLPDSSTDAAMWQIIGGVVIIVGLVMTLIEGNETSKVVALDDGMKRANNALPADMMSQDTESSPLLHPH